METVQSCGYYPIGWSVDSLDWRDYGVQSIIQTISEHQALENGAIILMHSDAKYTAEALEQVIIRLMEQGYQIVPVWELIYHENYQIDSSGRQIQK